MDRQEDAVTLYRIPQLKAPYMVAAWSGMGAVGLLAVNYLRQELGADLFGRIDPQRFYAPMQVLIQDSLIQPISLPETRFYAWNRGKGHDLVFLVGTEQPANAYGMAAQVVQAAERIGVERIYTAAASPTLIHHSKAPDVWGTATHSDLVHDLQNHGVTLMEEGTIGGLNGLLLAVAREHGIDGLCLLGEIPLYTTQMINPRASHAVLSVLTQMLDVEVNLAKLEMWMQDLDPQMDRLYAVLPDHAKEAFEREEGAQPFAAAPPPEGEPPLVADDAFFEGIERFLQDQREQDGEDDLDLGDLLPS